MADESAAMTPEIDEPDELPDPFAELLTQEEEPKAPAPAQMPAVDIPQNELDAFFDNIAAERASPSFDEIEEPELDWFVPPEPVVDQEPDEPEADAPPPPTVSSGETLEWLN